MQSLRYTGPKGSGSVPVEILESGNAVISAADWKRIAGANASPDTLRFENGGGEPRPFMGGAIVVVPCFRWRVGTVGIPSIQSGGAFSYREALRGAFARCNDAIDSADDTSTLPTLSIAVFHSQPRPVLELNRIPESEMIYLETIYPGDRPGIAGRLYPCNACGTVLPEKA